jgi:protein-disulfide isomerase|tara:strand:+ start:189797 stop:190510 length:714 start_codon:yes stop_codon:yes gene_type:complete
MRIFLTTFLICVVVSLVGFGYFFVLPQYKASSQEKFVPIEVNKKGFAKKTLQDHELADIFNTDTGLTILGDENAALRVIVFYDYNCPYCVIEETTLHEAMEGRSDVRVVIRPVPFMGEDSFAMAKLAMAAARMGVFPAFHEVIFNTSGKMNIDRAIDVLDAAGLPVVEMLRMSEQAEIGEAIDYNQKLAIKVGAHYVPSFVIGRRLYMPMERDTRPEEFHQMFDEEIKNRTAEQPAE